MEQLDNLHSMSIAELRKILKDNNIKETSSSKQELIEQVTEISLTNMMIQNMMETETCPKTPMSPTKLTKDPRTVEREQQDKEYQEALFFDQNGDYLIKQPEKMDQFTQEPIFEELSPKSLRSKRLAFYNQ